MAYLQRELAACPECGREMPPGPLANHLRAHGNPTPGSRVPLGEQLEMVRLYRRGDSMEKISNTTFWSVCAVKRVLQLHDVKIRARGTARRRQITTEETLRRCELYRNHSLAEVAEICGCSVTSVLATLRREGVVMHTRGWGMHRRARRELMAA